MVKKKRKEIVVKLSNRYLYALIVIGILTIVGVGVYAYGTSNPSTFGHSSGELEINWEDINNIPSGFSDGVDNTGEAPSCSALQ